MNVSSLYVDASNISNTTLPPGGQRLDSLNRAVFSWPRSQQGPRHRCAPCSLVPHHTGCPGSAQPHNWPRFCQWLRWVPLYAGRRCHVRKVSSCKSSWTYVLAKLLKLLSNHLWLNKDGLLYVGQTSVYLDSSICPQPHCDPTETCRSVCSYPTHSLSYLTRAFGTCITYQRLFEVWSGMKLQAD